MSEAKVIWLPKSETSVRITDGKVQVWEDMKMTPHALGKRTGFRDPGKH